MKTVRELIEILQQQDPNAVVIISRDGNSHDPFSDIGLGTYDEVSAEYGLRELTEELRQQGYTEEDIVAGTNAIVLYSDA